MSMINLHWIIGNNNTCCGVVVVAGRLMAVFSRYSNNSSAFSPILRGWEATNEKQVSQFYPSQKHFVYPYPNLVCEYLVATHIMDSFVVMKLLLK